MAYLDAINAHGTLVKSIGLGNSHLVWAVGLYIEEADLEALASQSLTDGPNDKKIDFINLDVDSKRIIIAQGFYATVRKDSAPANKASDLNTAAAWFVSGTLDNVPEQLKPAIEECRDAIDKGEVEAIELLYVHNLPESVNVNKELQTAAAHLRKSLSPDSGIAVTSRELGEASIEHLFLSQDSHIDVKDEILCPAEIELSEKGPTWEASVLSVPGSWLHELYDKHGDRLFSANYRGFLGISRRKRINTGIRQSAEAKPQDFWVFNNGITLLTQGLRKDGNRTVLTGISIINGAQTTGSIGSVDIAKNKLKGVKVLCRVIQCTDPDTISEIVKYNNTQNAITSWDQYSNEPEQVRIEQEFKAIGHTYSKKRGFSLKGDQLGVEEVMQPLLAFHGRWQDANRGKNGIFERKPLYANAFEGKKARHILFVYSLARAVDERRLELKRKSSDATIIALEEEHLKLLRVFRFKHFFVGVVARVLETVLGAKVDVDTVAFSPAEADAKRNTLLALIAAWAPVVETVLSYVHTTVTAADLPSKLYDDEFMDEVVGKVGALLYSTRSLDPFAEFKKLVSPS
ncbi:MAG: AIPR family protein [Flavobacteriales bacterium]|nr:AIPR family protein [Flavobacteriales bacterium]